MIILTLMLLVLLAVIFGVFFLIFKLIWLVCKKNTNRGPLIGAGICTLGCTLLMGFVIYTGYRAIISPFEGIIANAKTNPTPVYGERTYTDDQYPFALTVYDGMDFSKWINLGNLQLKVGIDTNLFKKDADGKDIVNTSGLASLLIRQTNASDDPFVSLQNLFADKQQHFEITSQGPMEINGMPAYQINGNIIGSFSVDTDAGVSVDPQAHQLPFWLAAIQTQPHTIYYVVPLSLDRAPGMEEQAQQMIHSFNLVPAN